MQSNPAFSNSVNSKSPLFQTKIEFSWIYLYVFSHLLSFTISHFELSYFKIPAISNSSLFPYTLNQPRYFELVKKEVQEETPRRPTKSEVHQTENNQDSLTLQFVCRWGSQDSRANKPVVISHDPQKY